MLFKRRKRKSFLAHARNFFWPSMGWRRTYDYIKHRILRLPASNHSIALGLSMGCIVSWTPLFGFHIIQCFILCFLARGNFLAGLLGTLFGNPWTFPFLLWISYEVGKYAFILTGHGDALMLEKALMGPQEIGATSAKIFLPTLVGGYIMALVTLPIFYLVFFNMIKTARAARIKVSKKVHGIIDHRKEKKNKK